MFNRRLYETIRLRYSDIERVSGIVKAIRAMLEAHDEVDTEEQRLVYFQTYGEHALEITVYAFANTTEWYAFQTMKQDILLRIHAIVREHGARLALPVSELHFPEALGVVNESARGRGDETVAHEETSATMPSPASRRAPDAAARQHSPQARKGESKDASHDQESDA